MRVVKGKVVGNTVVMEELLPDGLAVDVVVHEAGDDEYRLTDEMEADLADAMEEAQRGEGISAEAYFARLPPFEASR
jgi:hypothetical protein